MLERDFVLDAPDRIWVADITYAGSREGWLNHLAFVLDAHSGKVVGWSTADPLLRTGLVVDVLGMAIHNRRARHPGSSSIRKVRGRQYTSV